MGKGFVHLHVHTAEGSLLDGMGKITELVAKAKASGMGALAITDHGAAYGLVDFYDECKKQGIKPILGCEVYEAPGSRFVKEAGKERYYHLILLVKNEIGYKNLCILISRSNTEGYYYKPRIDMELLEKHHEGLICLSACVAGRVPKAILTGNSALAEEEAMRYKKIFGNDYYMEIQNHGIPEEGIVAQEIVRISRKLGIKIVCTNDVHYVNSEDAKAHEWLLCMQTNKKITDEDRMVYEGDYSLKTEDEMRKLFPSLPEAFNNTLEIAEKCNFDFKFGEYRMPKVKIPEKYGNDYFGYLETLTWEGWEKRYPEGHPERETARKDLEYELSVVKEMGFAEYFLDTRKTVVWAKDHGILVGPGRGSGAGSRMLYCLRITDIDPIKYNLLFERFLNPERVSMPDIDVDYNKANQDEIIAFEAESNGKDRFAKIETFVTLQPKGILRDVARVAGYPVSTGSMLASLIPDDPKITLSKAWEMNPAPQEYVQSEDGLKELWDIALKLEGTRKALSTHACGHIPTPVPCEELFPVRVDEETGYLVCQYDMVQAERLGNLKKDLLMLRNLTIIDSAQKAVRERHGVDIPLWTEEILNDSKTLAMIADGDTDGVFQLESDGMKSFMKQLRPSCFEDIIAGVSLYRPGPMDFIPDYIRGKHEPSTITYATPKLEPILAPTYGVIVYQEQVMQIVRSLAGFSLGRADVVRRAMSKKKEKVMQEERANFIFGNDDLGIQGCIKNGIDEDVANKIYDDMIGFAKYAFNKSHAAAYAAISMQTAYLKAHYPTEFAAGLLTSVMDKTDKLSLYVGGFRKKGIHILPPDLNTSGYEFTVGMDSSISYGLASIKNISKNAVKKILEERAYKGPYKGLRDFVKRNFSVCDSRTLDGLIHAGAFDFTGYTRRAMALSAGDILSSAKQEAKYNIPGQMTLFDMFQDSSLEDGEIDNCKEYTPYELLYHEKEATGSYLSRHPLDNYGVYLKANGVCSCAALPMIQDTENAYMFSGVIVRVKKTFTKKSGEQMAFLTIEDKEDVANVIVFPRTFQSYHDILEENLPIMVFGKVTVKEGEHSIVADRIINLTDIPRDLDIQVPSEYEADEIVNKALHFLNAVRVPVGDGNVYLRICPDDEKPWRMELLRNDIAITKDLYDDLVKQIGEEHLRLSPHIVTGLRPRR